MTKAEKISALLSAILVIICAFSALSPSPSNVTTQRSATKAEMMSGGGGEDSDELLPGSKVNINTASLETLRMLPGVGETLGQRIIDWREENGEFKSVDELVDEIDGIGEKNIEEMREYIVLEDDAS